MKKPVPTNVETGLELLAENVGLKILWGGGLRIAKPVSL